MERMGPRRAGQENGDRAGAGGTGALRAAAVTVAAVAALAGCSVTVQPKDAAASRPLSSTPSATAPAGGTPTPTTPSTQSASVTSSAPSSPSVTPSDVDHTVCTNAREILATLKSKLVTDKDSNSRTAQDYHVAGSNLRLQDTKTDNTQLSDALRAVGTAYQVVGRDVTGHDSTTTDLGKVAEASKPLATLCGGGDSSGTTGASTSST